MRRAALALTGSLLTMPSGAGAQTPALSDGVRFTLKPHRAALLLKAWDRPDPAARARISALAQVPVNDRTHELTILVRRQKLRLLREQSLPSPSPINPHSRFILMLVEDRAPLGDMFTLVAGFQGMKLSNRYANVTAADGNMRLRSRDWFMPHARIEITPAPTFGLAFGYRETMRAYGDTDSTGPLGLGREDFRSLASRLKPEKHSRMQIEAEWSPVRNVTMGMTAYRGQIDDRLSFIDRTYLPLNSGSARLHGIAMAVAHKASQDWHWSVRYNAARLRAAEGYHGTEESVTVEAGWASGPWSATLRGTKGSRPALAITSDHDRSARIEGEIRYRLSARMPACVTLRLTDPDRLAGTALLRDELSSPFRATDQARGLMLSADLRW